MKHAVRCQRCSLRWAQKAGLCRTCERETGADNRTIFERERDRLARRPAPQIAEPRVCQPRAVVVNGVEYEVVWDGAAS